MPVLKRNAAQEAFTAMPASEQPRTRQEGRRHSMTLRKTTQPLSVWDRNLPDQWVKVNQISATVT
jgi:hypothetical protein